MDYVVLLFWSKFGSLNLKKKKKGVLCASIKCFENGKGAP